MQIVRESIFVSAIRSFFNAFFALIGIIIGLVVLTAIFAMVGTASPSIEDTVNIEILPNAKGNMDKLPESSPAILQIDVQGVIGDYFFNADLVDTFLLASRKGVLKNDRVKGILLNINSPGGSASDSDKIYRALLEYKKRYDIPVYAYVNYCCASGSYYVACASDKIIASPVSMIGSIGVKSKPFFNFWDMMKKYGVDSLTLTEGKYKEKFPMFAPLGEGPQRSAPYNDLSNLIKDTYERFVGIVDTARKDKGLTAQKLVKLYGAQIYATSKAEELGYIDGEGSYDATLQELVDLLEIKNDLYQVVRISQKKPLMHSIMNGDFGSFSYGIRKAILGDSLPKEWEGSVLYYYDANE